MNKLFLVHQISIFCHHRIDRIDIHMSHSSRNEKGELILRGKVEVIPSEYMVWGIPNGYTGGGAFHQESTT